MIEVDDRDLPCPHYLCSARKLQKNTTQNSSKPLTESLTEESCEKSSRKMVKKKGTLSETRKGKCLIGQGRSDTRSPRSVCVVTFRA